ncbi:MAG: hypothetical protein IAE83_05585 [Anaerolinea sp.]|nr:hypothetical protein [Anaerolinea sp.]
MAKRRAVKAKVEYTPPSREQISSFAQQVCKQFGEQIDPVFNTPEAKRDLTAFFTLVTTIWAKHLNRQQST